MLREASTDFAFVRAFKAGAKDLRRRVAHLFTFNDDENSAIAYVLVFASIMYICIDKCAESWDDFSNHTAESKREIDFVNRGSLEGVHDTVHLLLVGVFFFNFDACLLQR
jgi:tyrosinase